jgi:WD40 repeat protein
MLVFSSDGKKIVGTKYDGAIDNVWDAESGEVLQKLEATDKLVNSRYLSPDGKKILVATKVFDVESNKELLVLPHTGNLWFAAFSPDGKKIITGNGLEATARLFDAESGKELQVLRGDPKDQGVYAAFFSPDGQKVITAGYGVSRTWDVPSGKELHKMDVGWKHPGGGGGPWVFSASFLPDGKRIITTYNDDIRIWDAETGKEVRKVVLQGLYRERGQ